MIPKSLSLALMAFCSPSVAWSCSLQQSLQVIGDVPAAISYDVYIHLYPLDARKLANFVMAGQVRLLPDGTRTCLVANDGVADPSAALVDGPDGKMAYWLPAARLRPANFPHPKR
ncbi:hypothetical protein Q8F57_045455 [Paraburkholderia terrae]|uniref:hypothetical protein n=1 Tax=Paraburkholderia terrae TaxID=311230 RepID=UPI00296AF04E|nr:hypothetical protein [Paraburkholderia terrae]MDW3660635.1 hypothetical protein [Paraburkholderia terrae]